MDMEQFRARLLIEQRETVEAIQQAQQSAAPVGWRELLALGPRR